MKLVNSSVNILDFKCSSIKEVFNNIEFAGRTCYKSVGTRYFRVPKSEFSGLNIESKEGVLVKFGPSFDDGVYISIADKLFSTNSELYSKLLVFREEKLEDSSYYENQTALDFVDMLIKNKHYAMLEHGTIYLTNTDPSEEFLNFYSRNPYSKTIYVFGVLYVTTNLRVLIENDRTDDLIFLTERTKHPKRISVKFICSRGIANEIVRHRVFSFAQESTRYCNYSKHKFGNSVVFIKPSWFKEASDNVNYGYEERIFLKSCYDSENNYFKLIGYGMKAQDAREVLNIALKTEIVVTGFESDWQHFFVLRCDSHAHPDMQVLAKELKNKFSVLENEI